eukprot:SAG31_NODE_983_length_10554_cov_6.049259_7_plen_649_part_00
MSDQELHDIGDIRSFQLLQQICAEHMDDDELAILYQDVVSLAENPACHIDTSQIISLSAAKVSEPACETDEVATSVCEQFIAAGSLTCEQDMCPVCGQRHTCDRTCGFPCAEGADGGRHLAEVTYAPINLGLQDAIVAAQSCPLNEFGPAIAAISEECCYEHSREGLACGLASYIKFESLSCVRSSADEGETWRYHSEGQISAEDCAVACCEADDCVGFEHATDAHYCAFWIASNQCQGPVSTMQKDTSRSTYVLSHTPLSFIPESTTWHDAEAACEERGLVLARLDSKDEFEAATLLVDVDTVWIGLHNSDANSQWSWTDGGGLHSTHWAPGEPSANGTENCVQFRGGSNEWNDSPCNSISSGSLCQLAPTSVDEVCPHGLPSSCSFNCGRVYTAFMHRCSAVLGILVGGGAEAEETMAEYTALESNCVQMDPTSMVMAMFHTECDGNELCGDGQLQTGEECDAGPANIEVATGHEFIVEHLGQCTAGCFVVTEDIISARRPPPPPPTPPPPPDPCEYPDHYNCGLHGDCDGDAPSDPRCVCRDGYSGALCATAPDPCEYPDHYNCGPHGDCDSQGGDPRCVCRDGYSGLACDAPSGDLRALLELKVRPLCTRWILPLPHSIHCGPYAAPAFGTAYDQTRDEGWWVA